jgi:hypothetical protein
MNHPLINHMKHPTDQSHKLPHWSIRWITPLIKLGQHILETLYVTDISTESVVYFSNQQLHHFPQAGKRHFPMTDEIYLRNLIWRFCKKYQNITSTFFSMDLPKKLAMHP